MEPEIGIEALRVVVEYHEVEAIARKQAENDELERLCSEVQSAFPDMQLEYGRVTPPRKKKQWDSALRIVVNYRSPTHATSVYTENVRLCRMRDQVEYECEVALAKVGDNFSYPLPGEDDHFEYIGRTPANWLIFECVPCIGVSNEFRDAVGAHPASKYSVETPHGTEYGQICLPLEKCREFAAWDEEESDEESEEEFHEETESVRVAHDRFGLVFEPGVHAKVIVDEDGEMVDNIFEHNGKIIEIKDVEDFDEDDEYCYDYKIRATTGESYYCDDLMVEDGEHAAFCECCSGYFALNGSVCWFENPIPHDGGECYSMCSHCREERGGTPARVSYWD